MVAPVNLWPLVARFVMLMFISLNSFTNVYVENLFIFGSDHGPILLYTDGSYQI